MKYTTKGDITGDAIRQAGFWLIGGHNVVTKVIGAFVLRKKLKGPHLEQHMADLVLDRTEVCPPLPMWGLMSLVPGCCKHIRLEEEE